MSDRSEVHVERATPVLKSGDYPRSRAFYAETLGFRVVEEGGDPPRFGIFKRGDAVVFVDAWHGPPAVSESDGGGWAAYIHVGGLDALFAELEGIGAPIRRAIETTVYDMREFEVADPDGNVICFGEDAE